MDAPLETRPKAYIEMGGKDPAAQHTYVRVRTFEQDGRDSTEHYGRMRTETALPLLSQATQNQSIIGEYNSTISIDEETPETLRESVLDAVSRAESIDPFDIAEDIEQETCFSTREAQMYVLKGYYRLQPSECASLLGITDQSARNLVTKLGNRIEQARNTVSYARGVKM